MAVNEERLEDWQGKTIMVFCAHEDDEIQLTGTMALLKKNGNRVLIVYYTNGNKGTHDLEMTSEHLARIRKKEAETANAFIGIPPEDLIFLGHDDGELEYVPKKELCGQVARLIRMHRPDYVFSFDPGREYEQWHKTDHRTAAFNTVDAARAAYYHLYYPEQLLVEDLKPFRVSEFFYFGSREPNCEVDISEFIELRMDASAAHVSQRGAAMRKYSPEMQPEEKATLQKNKAEARGGKHFEKFRQGGASY